MIVLALIKTTIADPELPHAARRQMGPDAYAEERNWLWGAIGRQAAGKLSPPANGYFATSPRTPT